MSRCEQCGVWIRHRDDVYTYKDRNLCEDCATTLQEKDFGGPRPMGCSGPVWRILADHEDLR